MFVLTKFEILNEPCNVCGISVVRSPVGVHTFPSSSSASRWVNNFKDVRIFSSRKHIENFNSRTVSAKDPNTL